MSWQLQIKDRLRAGGVHLLMSLVVVTAVALLVFGLWFPGVYREFAGGIQLLVLVMAVDVTLGPLLTFAVFDRRKGYRVLRRDVVTIAVLQLAALSYGLYTVYQARPVALVFELDRFRVIAAADVLTEELPQAMPELRELSLSGPRLIAVRKSASGAERSDAMATAIVGGVDTSQRPKFWIPYGLEERKLARQSSRPLATLVQHYPAEAEAIHNELRTMGVKPGEGAWFLPVRARTDAVAILNEEGAVLGFLVLDGFFE